jgi:hypothetical protein
VLIGELCDLHLVRCCAQATGSAVELRGPKAEGVRTSTSLIFQGMSAVAGGYAAATGALRWLGCSCCQATGTAGGRYLQISGRAGASAGTGPAEQPRMRVSVADPGNQLQTETGAGRVSRRGKRAAKPHRNKKALST